MKAIRKRIFILLLASSLVFPMLSKPALAEEQVIITEAPDPDIADLQAAREAVENTKYPAAKQEEQSTEAAATSYVEEVVKQAVNNDAIGLSIHVDAYTAPKAGDADYPDGTDGQVAFTVTLTKGGQEQSTARLTLAIKATPYAGVSNQQVMDKAASLLAREHTLDFKLGDNYYSTVLKYFNDLLAECGDLDYVDISPGNRKNGSEMLTVTVYIEKGQAYYGTEVNVHMNEERDPDLATVKTAIEHGDYGGIRQYMYDDLSINQDVSNRVYAAIQNSGVVTDRIRIYAVNGGGYVPSITGDADNPNGTPGSYTFTVTYFRLWQVWTTDPITVPIVATTFREVNEQALAAVKAALVDGVVDVAFGASQADKTAAVQSYVDRLLSDPKVTATVAYNSDTGSYDVALVRGNVSDSKSLTMTMNEGVDPDIAIVASAKEALVDGEVNVVFEPTQADKTAAVQSYVNRLLTGDAAGVTAVVTFNSGSDSYDVALSKGVRNESTNLHVTFKEAPDPDIAIVQAAKEAVESAEYPAAKQEEQSTEAAAMSYVEEVVKQAVNNDAIGLSIHVDAYTAPKAGDADYPDGTDGQIAFTVTLTKGGQVQSTALQTLAIKATPYAGVSNQQVMDKAASLLAREHTLDFKLGDNYYSTVLKYFNDLLAECGDLDYVDISPGNRKNGSEMLTVTVYIEKGQAYYGTEVNVHMNEERDPDLATVKTAIEHGDYGGIRQYMYDDLSINQDVSNRVYAAIQNSGVVTDRIRIYAVNRGGYVPSITGDADNPNGTPGSYTFTVTYFRLWQVWTTDPITVLIIAEPFEGLTNAQAVAAAKTALVDGTVDIAFGASQADKTAAVQSYVNGLLTGDAAGVTASVAYNSGSYEVTLSKGSATDSKNLTMTVNEAADPDIVILAAARAAAEGASYSSMTQATATSETVIAAALKATAEAAINNNAITVAVTNVGYTAPIAGDGDNVIGADGSYTFTITVTKGSQNQTTAQQTIAITATAFNGVTNVQAVTAAKTALVDGSVEVAFGALQADKTAAVQSYVNGLLIGDAAGVTATVVYNSVSGKYDVAISKGSARDSKSLTMTVTESADPDIAVVSAAKAAAEGASYSNMTQAAATSETVIASTLKATAEAAINNNAVTVTVTKVGYFAPIAGDAENPQSVDGTYTFTVTVAKGTQSQTIAQKIIAITAATFNGVTNVQAVAAAKAALVDGSVDVAFGASQADKTAAVQSYVNSELIGDAAGVTAVVAYNSGTGKYDVALSKGSASDSKSLAMTVNESADPDITIVAAAKASAEGASYPGTTQAAHGDVAVVKSYVENLASAAVNNSGVTITVNKVGYIAPTAGDADHPLGTDGSYAFNVTVAKGSQSQTTAPKTIAITATAYTGVTNAQAVAAAKAALVGGSVDVAFGASQADKTAAVQSYVNSKLTGDAAGVTATVTYNSGSGKYDVALSKGSASDSKSLTMTVNDSADPDISIVAAAKAAAEGAIYSSMTQAAATSESVIAAALKVTAEAAVKNSSVAVTINKVSYTAPIAGNSANRSGTDGSYIFTVTVSKGSQSQTTEQIEVRISATADTSGGTPGGGTPGGGTPGGGTPGGGTPGGGTPGSGTPGGGTPGGGTSFADIDKSDWFSDAVAYVRQNGLMSGTSEMTFSPHLTANRAMIATVLYRMAGNPHVAGESTFTDVHSGTWYTDAIKWAAQKGIVSGYGNNRFGIDDAVTREQLVAVLYRYAQQNNLDITLTGDLSGFADKDKISDWATESMKWAVGKGLLSGKGNGMIDPSGTATRAEIAAILMRFLIGQNTHYKHF
ncbi:S-layer homology domain-containing protein [Cohnella endophytica]|nr:S-layer homology domain-containing protein [Cohnella endophytica]